MTEPLKNQVEYLEHTGDIRIRVQSATLSELFVCCAEAMIKTMAPDAMIASSIRRTVSIDAEDLEQLLVAWLSEINYNVIVNSEIYFEFQIHELSTTHLSAAICGEKIDSGRHPFALEIKAVTYHQLYVRQVSGGWQAQIIFDI